MTETIEIKEAILLVLVGTLLTEIFDLIGKPSFQILALIIIILIFIIGYPESKGRILIFEWSETARKRYLILALIIMIISLFYFLDSC